MMMPYDIDTTPADRLEVVTGERHHNADSDLRGRDGLDGRGGDGGDQGLGNRRRKKRPSYGIRTVEVLRGRGGFGFTLSGIANGQNFC